MKIKGMYYSNLFILILLIAILFYILPLLPFFKRLEEFQKEFKILLDISDKIVSDIENISSLRLMGVDYYKTVVYSY